MSADLMVEVAGLKVRLEAINLRIEELEREIRRLDDRKPSSEPEPERDPLLRWGR